MYTRRSRLYGRPRVGGQSPWGRIQHVWEIEPGILGVDTPGHGGIWLDDSRLSEIPAEWETINGNPRWNEEDCEAAFILAYFETAGFAADRLAYCEEVASVAPRYAPGWEAMKRRMARFGG